MKTKKEMLRNLQEIPGVGESIAQDLWDLDIRHIQDLKTKDPQKMYTDLCKLHNAHIDRCMLYVLRCAVYYASHKQHIPKLLLWWNWSDKKMKDKP